MLFFTPWPEPDAALFGWLALLVPIEIYAMRLYMRAIRDCPLSHTLPYLAFTPVFGALTGWILLDEQVSGHGLAGILLVLAGAWLLNLRRSSDGRLRVFEPLCALRNEAGPRTMLFVAALYSLTVVMGKAALSYTDPTFFGAFYFVLLGVVGLGQAVMRRDPPLAVLTRRPLPHLALGLAMTIMVVAHFAAIAMVEAAYMIAVKRTSLLFGILYGALLFNERGLPKHLLAGGLMVAGVALLAGAAG